MMTYLFCINKQTTEESGRVTRSGQEETREAKAEMGGLC